MGQRVALANLYFIAVCDMLDIHASSRREGAGKVAAGAETNQPHMETSIHSDPGSPISGLFKSSW